MHPATTRMPGAVAAGLALAVILDTAAQVAWKLAVPVDPGRSLAGAVAAAVTSPWFGLALAALAAQLVNWLRVLARADLSFAQPFTALGYVTVLAVSGLALGERVPPARVAGVALILIGVACVSRTPVRTPAAGGPERGAAGAAPSRCAS